MCIPFQTISPPTEGSKKAVKYLQILAIAELVVVLLKLVVVKDTSAFFELFIVFILYQSWATLNYCSCVVFVLWCLYQVRLNHNQGNHDICTLWHQGSEQHGIFWFQIWWKLGSTCCGIHTIFLLCWSSLCGFSILQVNTCSYSKESSRSFSLRWEADMLDKMMNNPSVK